jgi:hypothetical protein
MPTKFCIYKSCGTLKKELFPITRYAEIHKQRPFYDNKKDIPKIVVLEIQPMSLFYTQAFQVLKIIKNFNFWWYFKVL